MDALLNDAAAPEEVPFQLHYTPPDLRSLLSSSMDKPEKRLGSMHSRILKHLAGASPALVRIVWDRYASASSDP